jgi:hypothetical protein
VDTKRKRELNEAEKRTHTEEEKMKSAREYKNMKKG